MLKSNLVLLFSMVMFLCISITNASAGIQNIAKITNEEDKETITLQLITDDLSDITHLKLKFINEQGKAYDTDQYSAKKAASGIVLYKVDGREVVKLKSNNFSNHQGGLIKLDYLYNGITGSRSEKILDLSRDGDTWVLSDNGKVIKKLHFISNKKIVVGTIGIKRIDTK